MAESQEDKDVDALISQMQSTLDKLKAAQRKDVASEDAEENSETAEENAEPKDLSGAGTKALRVLRAAKKSSGA